MADCYFHGYSGGPGVCRNCEEEDRHREERGTRGLSCPDVTQKDFDDMRTREIERASKKPRCRCDASHPSSCICGRTRGGDE